MASRCTLRDVLSLLDIRDVYFLNRDSSNPHIQVQTSDSDVEAYLFQRCVCCNRKRFADDRFRTYKAGDGADVNLHHCADCERSLQGFLSKVPSMLHTSALEHIRKSTSEPLKVVWNPFDENSSIGRTGKSSRNPFAGSCKSVQD